MLCPQARTASGTYNLIPAGLAQTKRKYIAARFPKVGARSWTMAGLGWQKQSRISLPAVAQEQHVARLRGLFKFW